MGCCGLQPASLVHAHVAATTGILVVTACTAACRCNVCLHAALLGLVSTAQTSSCLQPGNTNSSRTRKVLLPPFWSTCTGAVGFQVEVATRGTTGSAIRVTAAPSLMTSKVGITYMHIVAAALDLLRVVGIAPHGSAGQLELDLSSIN